MKKHEDIIIKNGKFISVTKCLSIINHPEWNERRGAIGNFESDNMLERTKNIGHEVHKYLEMINDGKGWDIDFSKIGNPINTIFENLAKWVNDHVEKIIVSEKRFFSKRYSYHGTPDAVYLLKGRKIPDLIDIKTGNNLKPEDEWQMSAYKNMLKENGIIVNNRIILHAKRNGKFKVVKLDPENYLRDFQYFLCAKSLYLKINKI